MDATCCGRKNNALRAKIKSIRDAIGMLRAQRHSEEVFLREDGAVATRNGVLYAEGGCVGACDIRTIGYMHRVCV